MKLFNKYQSRALQFALDLLSQLQSAALSSSQVQALAQQWGLDYADQVIQPLCRAGFLEQTADGYRLTAEGALPRLPLSAAERSTLAALLQIPESQLFLEPALWERLAALCAGTPAPPSVQRYAPAGEPLPQHPGPEGFRTLLKAAQRRWLIRYTYYSRDHQTIPRQAEALPWKLEYSAYDRRWWVILYDPGQSRTIKARLDNLEEIRLLGPSGVEDGEVEAAMDRLLEPEPVVLEVRRTRGTLERCFLVLENQLFERTRQVSEDCFYVSFRYYRFDQSEILRRLLYLGPGVRLISPPDLREALVALLDQALEA